MFGIEKEDVICLVFLKLTHAVSEVCPNNNVLPKKYFGLLNHQKNEIKQINPNFSAPFLN